MPAVADEVARKYVRALVEIAQEQYKQGMVTSLDVMSAELALTQAKTNHYQALHDLILAIAGLQRAIGVIE